MGYRMPLQLIHSPSHFLFSRVSHILLVNDLKKSGHCWTWPFWGSIQPYWYLKSLPLQTELSTKARCVSPYKLSVLFLALDFKRKRWTGTTNLGSWSRRSDTPSYPCSRISLFSSSISLYLSVCVCKLISTFFLFAFIRSFHWLGSHTIESLES